MELLDFCLPVAYGPTVLYLVMIVNTSDTLTFDKKARGSRGQGGTRGQGGLRVVARFLFGYT